MDERMLGTEQRHANRKQNHRGGSRDPHRPRALAPPHESRPDERGYDALLERGVRLFFPWQIDHGSELRSRVRARVSWLFDVPSTTPSMSAISRCVYP